jgi:hypothetical protein
MPEKCATEIDAVSIAKQLTAALAFDTTNFDTHIATTPARELARRGHAKSKRSDGSR